MLGESTSFRPAADVPMPPLLRRFLVALLLGGLYAAAPIHAQPGPPRSPEQADVQAVRVTIDALFDGMRAGDSAAVRGLFAPGARVRALDADAEAPVVETRTADAFAAAVGQPRDAAWDERVWDVRIRVDGPVASAWMPYVFYVGDERSHCGTNALHLVRRGDAWRIQHIAYTRRQDCTVPSEVRKE